MNSSDIVSFVLVNLKRMKLRVSLTVLGVIVGTTAIVAMVALGVGMQQSLIRQFNSLGNVNELMVSANRPSANPFEGQVKNVRIDDKLIKEISRINGVKSVVPMINIGNVLVKIQSHKASNVVIQGFSKKETPKISRGSLPKRDDDKAIILSNKFGESFDDKTPLSTGDLLGKQALLKVSRTLDDGSEEVRQIRVRVVAIAEEKGSKADYSNAYIPIGLAKEIWLWQENKPNLIKRQGYSSLVVTVNSPDYADSVLKKLEAKKLTVFSMKQVLDSIQTSFKVIQAVLGAIGSVALLVASIGIINTMIMSIYERTREIGIMKAVGASNKDIIKIFLGEAGFIGLAGGIGGTFLGWILSKVLSALAAFYLSSSGGGNGSPISFIVPLWLAVFAVAFATSVGLIAGIYPALRAARLNPLVALRHE